MGIWKYAEKYKTIENIARAIEICEKQKIPIIRIFVENRLGEIDYPPRGAWRMYREILGPWMVENTWGAEPVKGLEVKEGQLVVIKKRQGAFYGTELEGLLRNLGVNTLLVTGVSVHACVNATVVGAADRDFDIIALSDCCAAPSEEMANFFFTKGWKTYGVKVMTISELFE
jgi:nicotinamidase-related amidase